MNPQPYYHYSTHDIYFGAGTGSHVKVPAPLGSLPALHRGGSILPRRDLVRRAATLAWRDPITLVAALDITGTTATGSLYLDDGESFSNEKGEFIWRGFTIEPVADAPSKRLILRSRSLQPDSSEDGVAAYDPSGNGWAKKIADVKVGKVIVLGLLSRPSAVRHIGSGSCIGFSWTDGVAATAGRRRGGAGQRASELVFDPLTGKGLIVEDWEFAIEYGTRCGGVELVDRELPTGDFLCRNEGHIPASILRSRVNDGVCDPECCDGSDETDGKAHCPNRCKEVGEGYRKQVEEEGRKNRVGGAVRNDYIAFGVKEKKKLEEEVGKLSREISKLEEREAVAKVALDTIESAEAGDIERKKNSVLYQRIVEMQTAIKALRTHRSNLEAHVSDLSGILSDLSVRSFPRRSLFPLVLTVRFRSATSTPTTRTWPFSVPLARSRTGRRTTESTTRSLAETRLQFHLPSLKEERRSRTSRIASYSFWRTRTRSRSSTAFRRASAVLRPLEPQLVRPVLSPFGL